MLRSLVVLLAALTFTLVTGITVSHAARLPGIANPAPSAHAATAASMAHEQGCCTESGEAVDHDAPCALACAPLAMVPAGLADAWHPVGRTGNYPRPAATHAPGRTPGLPERPPQPCLLTA